MNIEKKCQTELKNGINSEATKRVIDLYNLCGVSSSEVENHLQNCPNSNQKRRFINNALKNLPYLQSEEYKQALEKMREKKENS